MFSLFLFSVEKVQKTDNWAGQAFWAATKEFIQYYPVDLKNSKIAIFMCIFHVHDSGELGEHMTMIKHPPGAPFISDSAATSPNIMLQQL